MAMSIEQVEVDVENFYVDKYLRVYVVPQIHGRVPKLGDHRLKVHHLQQYKIQSFMYCEHW